MTQSVELVFDAAADRALRHQWALLGEAGLPTAERAQPDANHRPHLTLYAAADLPEGADDRLTEALQAVKPGSTVRVGALMLFGPRRGRSVLVRQVTVSRALLDLQQEVLRVCGSDPTGQFADGRWSPHVTLARRVPTADLGRVVEVLEGQAEVEARTIGCRRWDGDARTAWWLFGKG